MALSVGDAVLTFLGDTTQLDQAFARVASDADSSMSAAADSVDQVGDSLKEVSFELDATGSNAAYAGGEIKEAMTEAKVSTGEARGEAALLGEMFGIHLPRHVRSFVAELPGVGEALNAAFAATAVLFLLQALVEGAEKLSEFISKTFVYTEAAKQSAEEQTKLNLKFIEHAKAISDAKEALEAYGLTAVQKTQKAIAAHSKTLADNSNKIEENKTKIAELTKEQEDSEAAARASTEAVTGGMEVMTDSTVLTKDNAEAIERLKNENAELTKGMQATTAEMAVLNVQLRDQEDAARRATVAMQAAFGEAKIEAEKNTGNALLDLQKAQAEGAVVFDGTAAEQRLVIEKTFDEKRYQLELKTAHEEIDAARQKEKDIYEIELGGLKNRLAEQKKLGKEGESAVAATQVQIDELTKAHNLKLETEQAHSDAQIEVLTTKHAAKLKDDANKLVADLDIINGAIQKSAVAAFSKMPDLVPITSHLLSMEDAAKALGVTLSTQLEKSVNDTKAALALLDMEYKGNLISLRDLQQGQMAAMKAQIDYDKEMGKAPALVAAEQAALDKLKASFDKVYSAEKQEKTFWDGFSTEFAKKSKNVGNEAQAMGQTMANAAAQMDQAFASAIMGALKSGQSIGAALEKATAEVLTNLATQAAAHALYCTAMGIAELALGVTDSSAAEWFAAAAEFGLVAGVSGAAGIAMSGGSGSGGSPNSSKGNTVSSSTNPSGATQTSSSGGGVNQTTVVPRLATGGIVSKRTMFMAGDSPSGGDAEEAVVPLSDPSAVARLSNALLSPFTLRAASAGLTSSAAAVASASAQSAGPNSGGREAPDASSSSSGGDVNLHVHNKGLLDSGTLIKTMNKYQKLIRQNRANFTASNSLRVTRRSQ